MSPTEKRAENCLARAMRQFGFIPATPLSSGALPRRRDELTIAFKIWLTGRTGEGDPEKKQHDDTPDRVEPGRKDDSQQIPLVGWGFRLVTSPIIEK